MRSRCSENIIELKMDDAETSAGWWKPWLSLRRDTK